MTTPIEEHAPQDADNLDLRPRGRVFPSPVLWRNHVFYQILPDRFSDGREQERPLFDRAHPEQFRVRDKAAWMRAGLEFSGGTLRGILSKLDYLEGLGITGLWINPPFKQRADLNTYHGYAIQNFLDIDPRFGSRQDLRDLVDAAKHIPKSVCRQFSQSINFYAKSIGKENFLIVGEITDNVVAINYLSLFGSLLDRALTAVLDINNSPILLAGAAKGTIDPRAFFNRFRLDSELTRYIQTGQVHVSVLDDHDMSCKSHKERFSANNNTPHRDWQVANAVAIQLLTPGIPCLYYGTEQAFDGNEGY
ncbi:MAG: alpha-amylase family glycosyl hydrolase, partial [Cyanobacteriota bacterium]